MQAPPGNAAAGWGVLSPGAARIQPAVIPQQAPAPAPALRRVLIVEDDAPLARLLASGLTAESFAVDLVHDGEAALEALASGRHALVMLDLNLPKIDGLALLQQLRLTQPHLPVLVLTGRTRTEDMVRALDQGADDCLLKPFSLIELMARVRVLLRRTGPVPAEQQRGTTGLALDAGEYRVERGGRTIQLTPREFAVLEFLMQHQGKPISRATLMQQVWNMPSETNTNIVDVYMKYLRDKIDGEGEEKLIQTVRGIGYVLRQG